MWFISVVAFAPVDYPLHVDLVACRVIEYEPHTTIILLGIAIKVARLIKDFRTRYAQHGQNVHTMHEYIYTYV